MAGADHAVTPEHAKDVAVPGAGDEEDDEDDEDETCGFCIYMRGGGCRKEFNAWSKCVDRGREEGRDFAEDCRDQTLGLQRCMEQHPDYYRDFLAASALEGSSSDSPSPEAIDQEAHRIDDTMTDSEQDAAAGTGDPEGVPVAPPSGKTSPIVANAKDATHAEHPIDTKRREAAEKSNEPSPKDPPPKDLSQTDTQPGAGGKESSQAPGLLQRAQQSAAGAAAAAKDVAGASLGKAQGVLGLGTSEDASESEGLVKEGGAGGGGEGGEASSEPPAMTEGEVEAKADARAAKEESAAAVVPRDGGTEEGGEEEEGGGKEEDEEEEEEQKKPPIIVRSTPFDPRFPSTNQARHCYTAYNEYHRCVHLKGTDAPECTVFQRAYRSICPSDWLASWQEARDEGTWPGRY